MVKGGSGTQRGDGEHLGITNGNLSATPHTATALVLTQAYVVTIPCKTYLIVNTVCLLVIVFLAHSKELDYIVSTYLYQEISQSFKNT